MDKNTCSACGMARETWPDNGVTKDGAAFCCQGCASGDGCTVLRADDNSSPAPTQDEIRSDRASGDFVRALQHERKTVSTEDYGTGSITRVPSSSGGAD